MTDHRDVNRSALVRPESRSLAISEGLAKRGLALAGEITSTAMAQRVSEARRFEGHDGAVSCVAFSPDSRFAVSGSNDQTLRVWEVETGRELGRYEIPASINSAVFSSDGQYILTGGQDTKARLWDCRTGIQIREFGGHTSGIIKVGFSPNSRFVISASWDDTVRVWNLDDGTEVYRLKPGLDLWDVAFSVRSQRTLLRDLDGSVHVWDLERREEFCSFEGIEWGERVAISPDGRFALLSGTDFVAQLWELNTKTQVQEFNWFQRYVENAYPPADSDMFSEFDDVFDEAEKWAQPVTNTIDWSGEVNGFEPEGTTVHLWDEIDEREVYTSELEPICVNALSFSPDGQRFVSGGGRIVNLWDVKNETPLCSLSGHDEEVLCVDFAPNGRYAISGSNDKTVRLWRLPP